MIEVPVDGAFDEPEAERADRVGFQLGGSLAPLFLIRTWTGEVAKHRALARHLGPDQPIYSFAPPRGTRPEHFPKDAQAWGDLALSRLLEVPHAGPYLIGGWSFAGVIALETAERLLRNRRPVALLVMLDTRLPSQRPVRRRGRERRSAFHKSVKKLDRFLELRTARERFAYLGQRASRRGEKLAKRWSRLRERLARRGQPEALPAKSGPPEDDSFETMTGRRISQLQRAIWVAYCKYRPGGSALPVAQLRTLESQTASGDASLGWGPWLSGDLESIVVPGEHLTMFDEPFVAVLAKRLAAALERARSNVP